MELSPKRLQILIDKLISNEITSEELAELNLLLNEFDADKEINAQLQGVWEKVSAEDSPLSGGIYGKILTDRRLSKNLVPTNQFKLWRNSTLRYAAAILLLTGIGTFLYNNYKTIPVTTSNQVIVEKNANKNLTPSDKVMLTLSDGSKVELNNLETGELTAEKNAAVINHDGQLVYQNSTGFNNNRNEQLYNTITTPVGVNYRLVLADGTKVWLNATSSLKFPVAFTGSNRSVELIGEGYFEVAPDKSKPFTVVANNMNVNVVGTHFNVSAYANDNNVIASLVEGIVDVAVSGKSTRLAPGQQANLNSQSSILRTSSFDEADVLAWKSGYFIFRNESIEDIMKKVSRWYNIDVVYKGDIAKKKFGGKYLKSSSLSELLTSLELTETVHFNVEGRRVTVMQ